MIISSDINRISNRFLTQIAEVVNSEGVIAYPTDTGYALACLTSSPEALKKIRQIRNLPKNHHFTLICKDLSHIGKLAIVPTVHYRILKKVIPGAHTYVFKATKLVPSILCTPKKKTIGFRVLAHNFCQKFTQYLDKDLLSVSLNDANLEENQAINTGNAIEQKYGKVIDLIVDTGYCPNQPSSVIDFSSDQVQIIRKGIGDLSLFT